MKPILCLALACAATLAGCAATPRMHTVVASFDEASARRQMEPGQNVVKGSALLRQNGGGVVTCAGIPVHLTPATEYARERIRVIYGNTDQGFAELHSPGFRTKFAPEPDTFEALSKKTRCDPQGFFRFEEVADGVYFVTTGVVWGVGQYNIPQGGGLMARVDVREGRTVEIVLTKY